MGVDNTTPHTQLHDDLRTIASLPLASIVYNDGQIEGVPKNPRFIRDKRFDALLKSIQDDPEMLALRELIVYPLKDKYVCICGNMRLRAMRKLGYAECPCKVLSPDTPAKKLRAYTVKDNLPFGENDMDALGNDWDLDELTDFGVEMEAFGVFDADEAGAPSLADGEKSPYQQMTFTMHDEQAERVQEAIAKAIRDGYGESECNENKNGNALAHICREFLRG